MQGQKTIPWEEVKGKAKLLSEKERAYILDKISNASFYRDQFGEINSIEERELIISIFGKIQEEE
jgi:hypothetical protein|tara:strand:+ start:9145 stop:9339 length:195 start_codon:yes stop_codon:yes gene_type:complete